MNGKCFRLFCSAIFICLFPHLHYAQGEANNWYFGNGAGISFNTNPPTVLTDGQLFTNEGCSSISAPNGDLLFYTDGRSIWDANSQLMPNADYFGGTGLNGDPSSTSSGLIVPHPTQDNLFFVFTVDEPHHDNGFAFPNQGPANPDGSPRFDYSDTGETIPAADDGFNNGFNYSVVDMTLNGGLGDVIPSQKNIELVTYDPNNPDDLKYKCGEKITAVRGEDCESVWVITHFKDTFYSFKIDDNGINETPVTSQVGPFVSTDDYRRAAIGYLKASPDGDKLICANQTLDYDPLTNNDLGTGNVMLFDFDNATGIVTNPLELITNVNAYGVEFSSGGTKAYATVINNNVIQLIQWDLEAANVQGSAFIFPGTTGGTGAIQLAPDGKIYRTIFGQNFLAVINNPELPGAAAGYTESVAQGAVSLGPNTGTLGLPPFIQSLFSTRVDITGLDTLELSLCDGDEFTLFYEAIPNASYEWRRDGEVLVNENSSTLVISQPDGVDLPFQETYTLTIDLNDGSCPIIGIANVNYFVFPETVNLTFEKCDVDFGESFDDVDLTQFNSFFIEDFQNASDFEVFYFESLSDAQSFSNPIPNPQAYPETQTPLSFGVIVQNNLSGCATPMELVIDIFDLDDINFNAYGLELDIDEFNRNTNTVTVVDPEGNIEAYEFSLDPNGPYQQSNVFENLLPGIYDIYVRDKNGCGIARKTFGILGIMEYFTPNGDGINDVWGFKGNFNNKQPLANVYIFDRYGKLLKSFVGLEKSWDGTYNNSPMPSQDYWYKIEIPDGRVLSGNFTLKR